MAQGRAEGRGARGMSLLCAVMDGLPGGTGKKSHYNGGQAVKLSPVQRGLGEIRCGAAGGLQKAFGGTGGLGTLFL